MIDLIKKTMLAGVGAAVVTKEKVAEALDDFVRQGKVSAQDARIMADKIADQGRREFEEMSDQLGQKLKSTFERERSDHTARIVAIEERLRALETRLAEPPTRSGEP